MEDNTNNEIKYNYKTNNNNQIKIDEINEDIRNNKNLSTCNKNKNTNKKKLKKIIYKNTFKEI